MKIKPPWLPYWGKANTSEDGVTKTHALACHLLDVAAVADVLLGCFPKRLERLAKMLDAEPASLRAVIVRLAALHDLGKFHPDFQRKLEGYCEEHLEHLVKFINLEAKALRHDVLGQAIAEKTRLAAHFARHLPQIFQDEIERYLFYPVMLHHGRPASLDGSKSIWRNSLDAIKPAIDEFIQEAFALIPCDGAVVTGEPSPVKLAAFSWALAGFMVLADWIGSNEEYFEYCEEPQSLPVYWKHAKLQAAAAVEKAGILPAGAREDFDPLDLLPKTAQDQARLSPLQEAAAVLPIGDGPNLFIVEDMTGAGKTEAALILAQRLLAAGTANGLYFALPTMATSNAMYNRMAHAYRSLFADDAQPSLVLAHGRRDDHDGFTESILETPAPKAVPFAEETDADETAGQVCARWIADNKRKAFFAHAGAGTIDQALLAALPRKHQALRLWALADRVLIADEVHSYDAYVNKELERLITFHTALGGSTILLSATLPEAARNGLVKAWREGAGVKGGGVAARDYPLITAVSASGDIAKRVDAREELRRTFPVKRIGSFEEAAERVTAFAKDGAPVAWIRNAVDDAIEACRELRKRGLEPLLVHARFAMGDRIEREQKVQERLGRTSTPEQRRGFVIVGTQILQESLDYDVDAMVTDLAPVDLIIQRAGRLWRHPGREGRLAKCELLIFSPNPDGLVDADWYRSMSPRAAAVYAHHGIIWRSAKALFGAGEIRAPEGLRDLIAKVYGPGEIEFPQAFEKASLNAEGKDMSGRSIAQNNLLNLRDGYGGQNAIWDADLDFSTRLENEPSVTFRLARLEDGKVVPWCAARDAGLNSLRHAWAMSEVRVQERLASGVPEPERDVALAVAAAKETWSKWDRQGIPLLLLEESVKGEPWRGIVLRKAGETATVLYDTRLGLRFVTESAANMI